MNKRVTILFNDGNNNGDIFIEDKIGVKIRCHKYVLEQMSLYFRHAINFAVLQKVNEKLKLESYYVNVIKQAINLLYNNAYPIDQTLEPIEYIQLYDLIDYLQFDFQNNEIETIINNIIAIFKSKLTEENWLTLLYEVHTKNESFKNAILNFCKNTLLLQLITQKYQSVDQIPLIQQMRKQIQEYQNDELDDNNKS